MLDNISTSNPPALTDDETAVLEIIELGWYKYLNANAQDNLAGRLWGMDLIDYLPTGVDMQINANGIAALNILRPNRANGAQ